LVGKGRAVEKIGHGLEEKVDEGGRIHPQRYESPALPQKDPRNSRLTLTRTPEGNTRPGGRSGSARTFTTATERKKK
jgi:hypothetical protein